MARRRSRARGRLRLPRVLELLEHQIWDRSEDVSLDNSLTAESLWVGADTPVGPVYLSYGQSEDDRRSIYLFVGNAFK